MSTRPDPDCDLHEHSGPAARPALPDKLACETAASIFRALGDPIRLKMLALLMQGEMCVTQVASELGDNLPAVSQRLKVLRSERIVTHRREGKHVYYALSDRHISELITNALEHAREH